MSSPALLPHRDRRHAYLRTLAAKEWPPLQGFVAPAAYRELPVLELTALGEETRPLSQAHLDASLAYLHDRRDCQDFAMQALVRMLYRYEGLPLFQEQFQTHIEEALFQAKWQEQDPGEDSVCWSTENHQILYGSAEYLTGQRYPATTFTTTGETGAWHRDRAAARVRRWLDWRVRFSFSEWNSACYYDEDASALVNLAEYVEDADIRRQATTVLHLLLFHVAVNSWRGITACTQGRAYERESVCPDATPMATLGALIWGMDESPPTAFAQTPVLLSASDFSIPDALVAVGRGAPEEAIVRERHGLAAEEGADWGVDPAVLENLPYYLGSGLGHHHLVCEQRMAAAGGKRKWESEFCDVDYYRRCKAEGIDFDTQALPHATGKANLYSYQTPDYVLSCAQDYRPGTPGYQQWIWCGAVGPRALVFTTNPAPKDVPYGRPGPWIGNGVLPRVLQHKNVLVCLHRVRPCPIYDQPPWHREDRIHAYVPQGHFDETAEEGGWWFGRCGSGYLGLRPLKPASWKEPEERVQKLAGVDTPYEWEVDDVDCAWICECGRAATHGSFAAFVRALSNASVEGGINALTYDSPSLGPVTAGWDAPLAVAGVPVDLADYPRFDNPYCQAPFGATTFAIACGEARLHLDGSPVADA